jgi:pyrroline-5-carboxylate reductase
MTGLVGKKIGFLGAGNMATALIGGLTRSRLVEPGSILASDVDPGRREQATRRFGVRTTADNREVVKFADIVVLAVKPGVAAKVLQEVGDSVRADQVVISICAGISSAFVESHLATNPPVLRVMPNTPALVGAGVSAIACGAHATAEHCAAAKVIFAAVGECVEVAEKHMDAVTAISGSGPAYFFYLMEALGAAGLAEGLPPGVTQKLVKQTALGAARLADESPDSPIQLRRAIASPGGTTEAAINILDELKVSEHVVEAVRAAAKRSREMGK